MSVFQAFESKTLELHDFYFTGDDYRYRFQHEAKIRFIKILREQFNSGVKYNGRLLKWNTVIEEKTSEIGRYLIDRTKDLNFAEPSHTFERTDNRAIREAILRLTQAEAKKLGIDKSTLYTLRQHARSERPFRLYGKVRGKLMPIVSDPKR